jgi:hypothetical protein
MQGLRHRKAAHIRRLLNNPRTTFRDVAARFKVSPELVRIIAKGMGFGTGRKRHRAQRLSSAEKTVRQHLKGLPVLNRSGFVVEPVVVDYPLSRRRVHLRHIIINGHRCAVRSAVRPPSVVGVFGDWWVRIKPAKTTLPVDFVLYRLPPASPARGWLVVPVQRGTPVAERDCLQPGQPVAAAGAAEENRQLVADQLAATPVKTGGRLIKHARYFWLLLAEGHLTRRLFGAMARRIAALPVPAG